MNRVFLNHLWESKSTGRLVKIQITTLRYSDSIDLRWVLRIYISNKFPSDAAIAAGLGTTVLELFRFSSKGIACKCGGLIRLENSQLLESLDRCSSFLNFPWDNSDIPHSFPEASPVGLGPCSSLMIPSLAPLFSLLHSLIVFHEIFSHMSYLHPSPCLRPCFEGNPN